MDTKNLILEELLKGIEKELKEFKNNPTPIKVTLKEDGIDMLDDYSERQFGIPLSQNEVDFYFENNAAEELGEVSFNQETAYLGFHYYVWKEMTATQKLITVLWFNELTAKNSHKPAIPVILNATINEAFKYGYMKDAKDYYLVINPFKLNDKDMIGAYYMHQILTINLEDGLNIALNDVKKGVKTPIEPMVLANYLKILPKPEEYDEYMSGYDLTSKQEKMVVLYAYQPLELKLRSIVQEELTNYMQTSEEVVKVPDTAWQEYKMNADEDIIMLETLKEKHYKNNSLNKLYESYFKEELNYLNKIAKKDSLEK